MIPNAHPVAAGLLGHGQSRVPKARQLPSELLRKVRESLIEQDLGPESGAVAEALRECGVVSGPTTTAALVEQLKSEMTGAGVLQPLLSRAGVTDVLVNGPESVWIDEGSGLRLVLVDVGDEASVRRLAQRLASQAGKRLDEACPFVDARLPDGTRLHVALGSVSSPGTLISLRVPNPRILTLPDLAALGAFPEAAVALLRALIFGGISFLVTGGAGSGKTTLLQAMLSEASARTRILIVEECAELTVQHQHVVSLEGRPPGAEGAGGIPMSDLVRQAMRMRPDRIVVGEVRGGEVADLLAAMNTGHEGCAGTVHANSAESLPERIEALGLAVGLPRLAVHAQLAAGLEAVVHVVRGRDGQRRAAGIWGVDRGSTGLVTVSQVWDFLNGGASLKQPEHALAQTLAELDSSVSATTDGLLASPEGMEQ